MVVVGAGHAGCEAALASSRLGCSTLLLTLNLDRIAWQVPAVSPLQCMTVLARHVPETMTTAGCWTLSRAAILSLPIHSVLKALH